MPSGIAEDFLGDNEPREAMPKRTGGSDILGPGGADDVGQYALKSAARTAVPALAATYDLYRYFTED
jgi:hypothetical protein